MSPLACHTPFLPSKSRRLQVENLDGGLRFFEIALVLVRLDDGARFIVNANHSAT
jgi:hypothetical protein